MAGEIKELLFSDGVTVSSPSDLIITSKTVDSGTYTPTLTDVANISDITNATNAKHFYQQIGTIVEVQGTFIAAPDSGTAITQFDVTLPVASTLTNVEDLTGVSSTCRGGVGTNGGCVLANTTGNTARIRVEQDDSDTNDHTYNYTFMYEVV